MFETNLTTLAAYLVYREYKLDHCRWERGVCNFYFEESDELLDDMETFIRNEGLVEPSRFSTTLTNLKRQMFEERDRNEPAVRT